MNPKDSNMDRAIEGVMILALTMATGVGLVTRSPGWGLIAFVLTTVFLGLLLNHD